MKRTGTLDDEHVIDYNLRDGGTAYTVFLDAQNARVVKAREIINDIWLRDPECGALKVVELGCSAGDISGHFARAGNTVIGVDVVPAACEAARRRYPLMEVVQARVEDLAPIDCDVLVLCEFLEHIPDPVGLVKAWLPKARYSVIGHPLVGDGNDPEHGHLWAYQPTDFEAWFPLGGHEMQGAWRFEMAGYDMAIGWGKRP